MTTASLSLGRTDPPQGQSGWVYGPVVDLLFGAGLGYLITVPILLYVGSATGMWSWPSWLAGLLALAISTPHYGATYLRVYEARQDRRRYAFFSVYFTVFMLLVFFASVANLWLGSLILTLYLTWSPWHFAGQNYGLGLMFMRRRGVPITPAAKRLFYGSFILSFLLTFVSFHMESAEAVYAPQNWTSAESNTYRMMRLGIPLEVARILWPLLAVAYLACVGGAATLLSRRGRLVDLAPAGLLVLTQALWFCLPALGHVTGRFDLDILPFVGVWLSAAHSAQYLWITSYYAKRTGGSRRVTPFLVKALLAGSAIVALPQLPFVPGLLGESMPYAAGMTVVLFSAINLHHFVLDGAIWKLRDGPVARALLRSAEEPGADSDAAQAIEPERHWVRPLVWVLGAIGVAFVVYPYFLYGQLMASPPPGNVEKAEVVTKRLAWLGRDDPQVWTDLGSRYESGHRFDDAIAAYRKAIALGSPHPAVSNRLVWLLLEHEGGDRESLGEALELAQSSSRALGPNHYRSLITLAQAYAANGRYDEALQAGGRALQVSRASGNTERIRHVERLLASIRSHKAVQQP